jgi:hypothetical protein
LQLACYRTLLSMDMSPPADTLQAYGHTIRPQQSQQYTPLSFLSLKPNSGSKPNGFAGSGSVSVSVIYRRARWAPMVLTVFFHNENKIIGVSYDSGRELIQDWQNKSAIRSPPQDPTSYFLSATEINKSSRTRVKHLPGHSTMRDIGSTKRSSSSSSMAVGIHTHTNPLSILPLQPFCLSCGVFSYMPRDVRLP